MNDATWRVAEIQRVFHVEHRDVAFLVLRGGTDIVSIVPRGTS